MTTKFSDINKHATLLASNFSARDALFDDIARVFHFKWEDKPAGDWIKATLAPTGYNAVIGAVRLMTSTEPQISAGGERVSADKLERAARAMWEGAGRVHMRPPHYDLIFSGVLFAEMCASVSKTADLVAIAEETGAKGQLLRARYIAGEAPYLFQSYNPRTCYVDRDDLGVRGLLRKYVTTWGAMVDQWGKTALDRAGGDTYDRLTAITVWDWIDWEQRCVWAEGQEPMYHEDTGLKFFPVGHGIVEGSYLFDKPEEQRLPLLYAYFKSGMWQRENLSLTTMFTLIHTLAANPQLVLEGAEDDEQVRVDRNIPGGMVRLRRGQRLLPLAEKVLDPAQMTGLGLTQQYAEESTIPKQALGAPPKDALAFSAISLLVQAGRLPLMGTKQVGGQVVGYLLNSALRWYKEDAEGVEFYSRKAGEAVEIAPEDIPDRAVVKVELEPDLPQDKLNLANIADALVRGGLASKEWVRQNILTIGQSDQMDRDQWKERVSEAQLDLTIKEMQAELEMKLAQKAQQMQARGATAPAPGAGGPMPVDPRAGGGAQPPAGPYPPGGQVTEGAPLTAPLPPGNGQAQG